MKRPNLFIIGAMKAGTTYLHSLLSEHPEIFMSSVKEPNYFVGAQQKSRKDIATEEQYLALFEAAGRQSILGESSTNYSKSPMFGGVPDRIRAFNPDSRFIYVLRDPVERTVSHYWHAVRRAGETRSLARALREEPVFLVASDYALQLDAYLQRFERTQIYVLTHEALIAAPEKELASVFEWLGVERNFIPESTRTPRHVTPEVMRQRKGPKGVWRLRKNKLFKKFSRQVPADVKRAARSLLETPLRREDVDMDEGRKEIATRVAPMIQCLKEMLGRDFPEWRASVGP